MDSVRDAPGQARGGLPHSEIQGSTIARISPWLFAACHVLHRLSVPRHPPDALVHSLDRKTRRLQGQAPQRTSHVKTLFRKLSAVSSQLSAKASVLTPSSPCQRSIARPGLRPRRQSQLLPIIAPLAESSALSRRLAPLPRLTERPAVVRSVVEVTRTTCGRSCQWWR
jgi:hypothetical protein